MAASSPPASSSSPWTGPIPLERGRARALTRTGSEGLGVRILHLLRHGQYSREPERLTPIGIAQAECLAARLQQEPVAVIHSSTAPRAQETAEVVRASVPRVPLRRTSVLVEGIPCLPRWKKMPPRLSAALSERPEE